MDLTRNPDGLSVRETRANNAGQCTERTPASLGADIEMIVSNFNFGFRQSLG